MWRRGVACEVFALCLHLLPSKKAALVYDLLQLAVEGGFTLRINYFRKKLD